MPELVDAPLERGGVLGVEPHPQAERALDLPLRRARQQLDGERVQPPVRVGEPPEPLRRALHRYAGPRRLRIPEQAGERRSGHRSASPVAGSNRWTASAATPSSTISPGAKRRRPGTTAGKPAA